MIPEWGALRPQVGAKYQLHFHLHDRYFQVAVHGFLRVTLANAHVLTLKDPQYVDLHFQVAVHDFPHVTLVDALVLTHEDSQCVAPPLDAQAYVLILTHGHVGSQRVNPPRYATLPLDALILIHVEGFQCVAHLHELILAHFVANGSLQTHALTPIHVGSQCVDPLRSLDEAQSYAHVPIREDFPHAEANNHVHD